MTSPPPPADGFEAEWEYLGPLKATREREAEKGCVRKHDFGGNIYPDGSCSCEVIRELRRAGCGAVEVNDDGEPLRKFTMPIPRCFKQTPQAAEHIGYAVTLRSLGKRATIRPDCMAVVTAANQPLSLALSASKRYAGITMDARSDPKQVGLVDEVKWVKAHRPLTGREDQEVKRDILGNKAADDAAREGRERHPPLPKELAQDIDYHIKRVPHIVRAVGTALDLFPPVEQRMRRPPLPRSAQEANERKVHWWKFSEGSWRCAVCSSWIATHRLPRKHRRETCRGPPLDHRLDEFAGNGHRLCRTEGEIPIIFCSRCGAWSSKRPRKLKRRCVAITPPGRQALARLAKGLCPWVKRTSDGSQRERGRLRHEAAYDADRKKWQEVGNRGPKRRRGGDGNTGAANALDVDDGVANRDVDTMMEDTRDTAHEACGPASGEQLAVHTDVNDATIFGCDDGRLDDVHAHVPARSTVCTQKGSNAPCSKPTAKASDLIGTSDEALATAIRDSMATRRPGREEPYGRGRWAVFNATSGQFLVADIDDLEQERERVAKAKRARKEPLPQRQADRGHGIHEDRATTTAELGGEHAEDVSDCQSNDAEMARLGCSTAGKVPRGDEGGDDQAGVQAKDAPSILVAARVGPGGPPVLCLTVADTAPVSERVATVAGMGEVGTLELGDHAREAPGAERGEPTVGPPSGRAAPLEDSSATTGTPQGCMYRSSSLAKHPAAGGVRPQPWQEENSPLIKPAFNLGAGPSSLGDALCADDGIPPPKENSEEAGRQ